MEAISAPRDNSRERKWHLGGADGTFLTPVIDSCVNSEVSEIGSSWTEWLTGQ